MIAGRYVLCDPIGAGGTGVVWRAFDQRRDQFCAAKLLRHRDAGELLRFAREQSVRLQHPHIVSPYAWAADDDVVLIASELIDGGSVQTLVGDFGPLSEPTVVTVLHQALSALSAVHRAELIHRDVKPGNLLLRATGDGPLRLVLTDFGLTISRRDARFTQTGMVIGTPGYLPPEVLLGGVPPDPRHDLFAVGRLALTLLYGAEREGGADSSESTLVEGIVDPALRRTVLTLLHRDPADRPASADAAAGLLDGAAHADRPRDRDGDPVEVVDQLPPLPPNWSTAARGPLSPATRRTLVDARSASSAEGDGSGAATIAAEGRSATAGTAISTVAPPRERRRYRSSRVALGGAGALGVLGLVSAAFWFAAQQPDAPSGPPGEPAESVSVSGSTPATGPSAPTVLPSAELVVSGAACGWQQEGDRRPGAAGVLTCTLQDGAYRWESG